MFWLTIVLRLTSVPVFLGALALASRAERTPANLVAGLALVLLGVIQIAYWSRPLPIRQRRAVAALVAMIPPIALLQLALPDPQPLLWLYPAIVAGSGLAVPLSAAVVGSMALAAVFPEVPLRAGPSLVIALGTSHTIFLSIVLAGLGMAAVRQLTIVNADLRATRADLAELAVARERERLAHDLHDLLGRTLSLIAVKAELANRLSAGREPPAEVEMREVQLLARQALRDVRMAVTGHRTPTIGAELAAARLALRSAGIEASVVGAATAVNQAHEATIAWAIREAVTNVVRHSGARRCWITIDSAAGITRLEVSDNGCGTKSDEDGGGLRGLAERIQALGGTIEAGPAGAPAEPGQAGRTGFRVRVTLATNTPEAATVR
jgi:two-component system sensor histidine kinase DesK